TAEQAHVPGRWCADHLLRVHPTFLITKPGALLRALFVLHLMVPVACAAQTRHEWKPAREAGIIGTGAALYGFSLWKFEQNRALPIPPLDYGRLPRIDRSVTRNWSPDAHRASNVLFGVATAASL